MPSLLARHRRRRDCASWDDELGCHCTSEQLARLVVASEPAVRSAAIDKTQSDARSSTGPGVATTVGQLHASTSDECTSRVSKAVNPSPVKCDRPANRDLSAVLNSCDGLSPEEIVAELQRNGFSPADVLQHKHKPVGTATRMSLVTSMLDEASHKSVQTASPPSVTSQKSMNDESRGSAAVGAASSNRRPANRSAKARQTPARSAQPDQRVKKLRKVGGGDLPPVSQLLPVESKQEPSHMPDRTPLPPPPAPPPPPPSPPWRRGRDAAQKYPPTPARTGVKILPVPASTAPRVLPPPPKPTADSFVRSRGLRAILSTSRSKKFDSIRDRFREFTEDVEHLELKPVAADSGLALANPAKRPRIEPEPDMQEAESCEV